jgi:4-methyl-5(b-hydroxyethyl)-thiazole monophosphate biosynthesis
MAKRVLEFIAEGFEDVEAVTPADYLRRAGLEVVLAAVGANTVVKSSRGLTLVADTTLAELASKGALDASAWDGLVIPGGMPGASNIAGSVTAVTFLKDMHHAGKLIAAICASPAVVLAPLGILSGKRFTCFPGMEKNVSGAIWKEERVVVDGNLITSRSAGTAGEWAYEIITKLMGSDGADKVASAVLLQRQG